MLLWKKRRDNFYAFESIYCFILLMFMNDSIDRVIIISPNNTNGIPNSNMDEECSM